MSESVDITKLNDVSLALQQAFNTKEKKYVDKAIELLKLSTRSGVGSLRAVRADQVKIPQQVFISSGVQVLDDMLGGGGRKQELIFLAGIPSAGKSHLLAWIAAQYIIEGMKVCHFNGEDLISDVIGMYKAMLKKKELEHLFVADVVDQAFTPNAIEAVLEQMQEDKILPDVVVVDYMDIVKGNGGGSKQDWTVVSETTEMLRWIAKRFNVILFTASQMNYAGPNSGKGLARLHRAKVGKTAHADVILVIEDVDENTYFINVAKHKGRKMRNEDFTVYFDKDSMVLESVN